MNDARHYHSRLLQGQWFSSLPHALQHTLLSVAQVQQLDAGQVLFRRGDKPCGLYAVVEGGVRVGAVTSNGKEALLTRIEPPYWFGEISVFDGQPRTHDVFADSATTLLWISQSKLLALLEQEPRYWREIAQLMSQKLRQTFIQLEDMSLLPAPVRLARRLLAMATNYGEGEPREVIHLAQEQLALMLAISRQTTNQILRELESQGIVRLNYAEIKIIDLPRLQQAAHL